MEAPHGCLKEIFAFSIYKRRIYVMRNFIRYCAAVALFSTEQ
jgi:hypothetical protein